VGSSPQQFVVCIYVLAELTLKMLSKFNQDSASKGRTFSMVEEV
jgi:hypothetical protein